ncbi:MFS transporter [Eleftheria terrae]|uniref:MFS transporter n=1 Tax=Eleftheria terrae TaxID=1597781 RepID=UPI00263ADD29|nr:MFS transporter [Eleftheria terrae]WKB55681.1 MFS transporter [Eleftheria terrae]
MASPGGRAGLAGWPAALLLIGAGVVSAVQIGKVPAAMDALRQSIGLSQQGAGWLLSAVGVVGALVGLLAGVAVDRLGAKRVVVAGLLLQALAAVLATLWPGVWLLFAARLVEGLGFQAATVAAPVLIAATMPQRSRGAALAAWSTFMPLGMCLALVIAPPLLERSWQALWWASAALALGGAAGVWRLSPLGAGAAQRPSHDTGLHHVWLARGPLLLALLFLLFTTAYFAVIGFLPTLLSSAGLGEASRMGRLSAWAVVMGAGGNLAAAWLLARGARANHLLGPAFLLLAACAAGVLLLDAQGWVRYTLCLAFGGVAGLVPATLFAQAPRQVSRPELAGAGNGLLMQGNNLGLVLGPALAGALVERWGWTAVMLLVGLLCALAVVLVTRLPVPAALNDSMPEGEHFDAGHPGLRA